MQEHMILDAESEVVGAGHDGAGSEGDIHGTRQDRPLVLRAMRLCKRSVGYHMNLKGDAEGKSVGLGGGGSIEDIHGTR